MWQRQAHLARPTDKNSRASAVQQGVRCQQSLTLIRSLDAPLTESYGIPNKIHMSADTAHIIKDRFAIESRGIMDIKGKGAMETFLLRA
ncbi:adenylate/guanylate cyclase domain-containing protein [Luminiphilus sp.]|nr:adenylate/guanylate cyclase domain-containing protein [Luminiphilus sp.]